MPGVTSTSLLSSNKSDSLIQVQLHPLVLLTVSDYVTRHALRQQKGPIVGAIIGTQDGRDVTMEHAFECKLLPRDDGEVVIDAEWFQDRLQQFKDVHKVPALDFVGWFTLAPASGPQHDVLSIHQQLIEGFNESALLLAFHPTSVTDGSSRGGKLPFTVYETSLEAAQDNEDKQMQSADAAQSQLHIRFKEVPYVVDTGEAEMIATDFVARGGANATVAKDPQKDKVVAKGKGKSQTDDVKQEPEVELLSPEDEELISSLTAKANAIRMLQERVSLTKAYLQSIPSCYLNTPQTDPSVPVEMPPTSQTSHPILRSISAMLTRLPLLNPTTHETSTTDGTTSSIFSHEAAQQRSDVALVSLLGSLGSTLRSAQDVGKKAAVVENMKKQSAQSDKSLGGGKGSFAGLFDAQPSSNSQMPWSEDKFDGDEAYDDGDEDGVPDIDDGGVDLEDGDSQSSLGGPLPPAGRAFLEGRLKRNFGDAAADDEEMT